MVFSQNLSYKTNRRSVLSISLLCLQKNGMMVETVEEKRQTEMDMERCSTKCLKKVWIDMESREIAEDMKKYIKLL